MLSLLLSPPLTRSAYKGRGGGAQGEAGPRQVSRQKAETPGTGLPGRAVPTGLEPSAPSGARCRQRCGMWSGPQAHMTGREDCLLFLYGVGRSSAACYNQSDVGTGSFSSLGWTRTSGAGDWSTGLSGKDSSVERTQSVWRVEMASL